MMNHDKAMLVAKEILSNKRDKSLEEKFGIEFADSILVIELEYKIASALLEADKEGFYAGVDTFSKNLSKAREQEVVA
jgi:hypothetical protein